MIAVMFISIIPLSLSSSWGYGTMGLVSNIIFALTVIALVVGGGSFARQLRVLLNDGISDSRKRSAIQNIMTSLYLAEFVAVVGLVAVGINASYGGGNSKNKQGYMVWGW